MKRILKKRTKKIFALLTAAMLLCGCAGNETADIIDSADGAQTEEIALSNGTYSLTGENVKIVGRTFFNEDILWCALSGTGFECEFTGTKLDLTILGTEASTIPDNDANYARYAVYVDGERKIDKLLNSEVQTVNVIDSDVEVTATVRFIKLSECAMSVLGIKPLECEGTVTPTPEKALKLEIIGDSITCGYGVDDENPNHNFKTATEDFTKAYSYKTAQLLDADYSVFSISGWGIISGYTTGDRPINSQRLPKYYKDVGFSYNNFFTDATPQNVSWDFEDYVPDLIVINLGTNDDSYCRGIEERCAHYEEEYVNFLKVIHEENPNSKLLCCLGVMGDRLYPSVEKAAAAFKAETGFNEIYTFKFTPQDGKLGYAADFHPTAATHDRAAEELSEKIREIMG